MACHVVSVHGSARTAKIQTMRRVQNVYRDRLVRSMRDDDDGDDNNTEVLLPQPSQIRRAKNRRKTGYNEETIKLCLAMQDTLAQIVAIDF